MNKINYSCITNPTINNANSYIFVDENKNAILFDLAFSPKEILTYITKNQLKLKAIFLTHFHLDHAFGADTIANQLNVPVYIAQTEHQILKDASINGSQRMGQSWELKNDDHFKDLTNNEQINIENFKIKYYIVGGHTPGSTFYLVNDEFALVGDTLFKTKIGFHNIPGMIGYDDKKFWQSLNFIINNFKTCKILPGHHEYGFYVNEILKNKNHEFYQK